MHFRKVNKFDSDILIAHAGPIFDLQVIWEELGIKMWCQQA